MLLLACSLRKQPPDPCSSTRAMLSSLCRVVVFFRKSSLYVWARFAYSIQRRIYCIVYSYFSHAPQSYSIRVDSGYFTIKIISTSPLET